MGYGGFVGPQYKSWQGKQLAQNKKNKNSTTQNFFSAFDAVHFVCQIENTWSFLLNVVDHFSNLKKSDFTMCIYGQVVIYYH